MYDFALTSLVAFGVAREKGEKQMYPFEVFLDMGLYEICILVGVLCAFFLGDRLGIEKGFSIPLQKTLILSALLGVVLGYGAAVLFQAFYNFLDSGTFEIVQNTGATFYGGLIGGAAAFICSWFVVGKLLCKSDEPKKRFFEIADIAAVCVPLAHGFGRLGCFFAGCCHGATTTAWYGVKMYTELGWQTVVPVQLFEAAFLFVLAGVLFVLFKKDKGKNVALLSIYLIAYGIWRFFIEFARADDRGATVVSALTPSQLVAIILIAVGIGFIFLTKKLKIYQKDEKENAGKTSV